MEQHLKIVLTLTVGLGLAGFFGYLAQRFRLPSILGYLIAGYVIGPYSPGFVADAEISEQLAEIGVILMLFGVGLHFKLEDLINVKNIAIPGALGQTFVATVCGAFLVYMAGWPIKAGIIIGLAIGVASTVVLVRVLTDNHLLDTPQGHISIGWLVVEDILTVAVLILLPLLATFFSGAELSVLAVTGSVVFVLAKFVILAVVMFTWGQRLVAYLLTNVARLRSHELFTLTVIALVFAIAIGSALIFGTSIALGAFIAGMVIGQTDVKHQAAANALPLKDIFAIIFFLSIGMLFNPIALMENFPLFLGIFAVVLLVKPLVAFLIVKGFGYSTKIALTVAVALAQIGEFSFILAEQAMSLKLLPDLGYDIIVGCALISISVNPLLFQLLGLRDTGGVKSGILQERSAKQLKKFNSKFNRLFEFQREDAKKIIVVGFGPIGQDVVYSLKKNGYSPVVIEQNIDTVSHMDNKELKLIFGDAAQANILESAKIEDASLLVITIPDLKTTLEIVHSARDLNPNIRILARVNFLIEEPFLESMHINHICSEKETSKAFVMNVHRLIRG